MIIETKRLILRPPVLEDAEAMFLNWASDGDVTRFLSWPAHGSVEISRMIISAWVEEKGYQWMIELKEIREPIGSISVIELKDGCAELGYCIGCSWWHRGIMTEAVKALIDYLFAKPEIIKITAKHDVNNPNSGGVMRKSGMIFERLIQNGGRNNTGICDVAVYGIEK